MPVFETKILDFIRSLAASLQLSMLLPASILVGGSIWLVAPSALSTGSGQLVVLAFAIITVSYLLNAFNMPIIRGLEGYILADWPPVYALRQHQLSKFYGHYRRINEYDQIIKELDRLENICQRRRVLSERRECQLETWRTRWWDLIIHERERLEERFPPTPERVLATGLGNAIAAWEIYSDQRFFIDTPQLWTRFVPTLMEKKFAGFIEGEKALVDFFVNLLLVGGLLWIVSVPVFALTGRVIVGVLLLGVPVMLYLLYRGACVAATNWGTMVKSSFDLYRFELKKALNLVLPENATLREERAMWRGISEFLAFGETCNFGGFDYRRMHIEEKEVAPKEK